MFVSGYQADFLLDTGSTRTIIPYELFVACGGGVIEKENMILQTASGHILEVIGKCKLQMSCFDQLASKHFSIVYFLSIYRFIYLPVCP